MPLLVVVVESSQFAEWFLLCAVVDNKRNMWSGFVVICLLADSPIFFFHLQTKFGAVSFLNGVAGA